MSINIAIDAMGGDHAPREAVAGALAALREYEDVSIVLVGATKAIQGEIDRDEKSSELSDRIRIVDAPGVVGMNDDPVKVIRSDPTCSARVCAEILHAGEVQGVVNMGSTGAAVAAATLYCRRLPGVKRTGIAVPFPRKGGASTVIDGGANPDARPEHLYQYAIMGREYVKAAYGIEKPRISILSIGEEEHKGNRAVHATWEYFRKNNLDFLGNVEPRQLFGDHTDVAVADGFVGNIALKAAEAMAEFVLGNLAHTLKDIPGIDVRQILGSIKEAVDYSAYGGAPLLGVEGAYLIGHGRSRAFAFSRAVGAIRRYVLGRVGDHIVTALAEEHSEAGS